MQAGVRFHNTFIVLAVGGSVIWENEWLGVSGFGGPSVADSCL